MDDNKDKLGNVLRLPFAKSGYQKGHSQERAFTGRFNEEIVLHAQRAQARLDRAYKIRSQKLVERLRNEVLTKLMIEDKKH